MTGEGDATGGWRLPAKAIENAIVQALQNFLADRTCLTEALGPAASARTLENALEKAAKLARRKLASAGDRNSELMPLVKRVVVHANHLKITLERDALLSRLGIEANTQEEFEPIAFDLAMTLQRCGVEAKLIIPSLVSKVPSFDANLVRIVAKACAWFEEITSGQAATLQELASREGLPASEVSRLLPLAFLSPSIMTSILEGMQPPQLTAERLKRLPGLPLSWSEQMKSVGS